MPARLRRSETSAFVRSREPPIARPSNDSPPRRTREIFSGCPEMKDGYLWVSEKPGWGIEVDEKAAAKMPFTDRNGLNGGWGEIRKADGTVIKQ